MSKVSAARGTQDILPPDSSLWQEIEAEAINIFGSAGYAEIRTPIFESTELFARAVGESSDIVNKEMYTFNDRSDRSLTLRPEGTAAIVRAYIEHGLEHGPKPYKAWYRGPMFRYERPQTGRYRQFHQIGIEAIGSKSIYVDIEIITLGLKLLSALDLKDLSLHVNSLGNNASRTAYKEALVSFLQNLEADVCEDCKRRISQNPLRVLDCKVPADQALYTKAPLLHDYYDAESQEIWTQLLGLMEKLDTKLVIDPKLVRGLDYYSHLVFEIKSSSPSLGQQSTVLAGGRYDALVSMLGGPESPAAGWALGIERLALLINEQRSSFADQNKFYIVSDDTSAAMDLAEQLRKHSLVVEFDYDSAKVGKQIEKAAKRGARYVIFYLADERSSGKLKVKDLKDASEQVLSSVAEIARLGLEAGLH